MSCKDCPYIKDEFDIKASYEDGICEEYIEQYCWCDKTGGKIWWYGTCGEASDNHFPKRLTRQNKNRRTKRERDQKYKQHLRFLAENCSGYPSPAFPAGEDGQCVDSEDWFDRDKVVFYKRQYRAKRKRNRYVYYKKYSNKCVRRYKGEIHRGNMYRRIFDYWYTVD